MEILIAGFGGGMVRGLMGYVKHQYAYKNTGFNIPYFLAMSFLSGIIGLLTAQAINQTGIEFLGPIFTPAMGFIVGYAGGDFVENIYKIIIKQSSINK
jgi:hypothetical protein